MPTPVSPPGERYREGGSSQFNSRRLNTYEKLDILNKSHFLNPSHFGEAVIASNAGRT